MALTAATKLHKLDLTCNTPLKLSRRDVDSTLVTLAQLRHLQLDSTGQMAPDVMLLLFGCMPQLSRPTSW